MGLYRLLLAISVVIAHGLTNFLGFRLIDAAGSVWIFFAISGFLITLALDGKYGGGPKALAYFYWNRVVRLYPAYWTWLAITIAAYTLLPPQFFTRGFNEDGSFQSSGFWSDHFHLASVGTLVVAFTANITGLFADALLSLGLDLTTGALVPKQDMHQPVWAMAFVFIGQYWSIGVELCFYALAPLLTRHILLIAVVFALSVSGYLTKYWITLGMALHAPEAFLALTAPGALWIFMFGSAMSRTWLAIKKCNIRDAGIGATVCAAMGLLVTYYRGRLFLNPQFPFWEFLLLIALIPVLFVATATNRFDRFLGELSYPVYINHWLIIQIASSFIAPNGLLYAVITVLLAALTVFLIEIPSRRLKFGPSRPAS